MKTEVKIFSTPGILAEHFAGELAVMINKSAQREKPFTVALSGGSTPELLFKMLADLYSKSVKWEYVHFFWGDERCVPPENNESNYGMAKKHLFDKIIIPSSNIHRIRGEENPENEAIRYTAEISSFTESRDELPSFDLILLGLGEDGHTASIFPGVPQLMSSEKICEVAIHPVTGQKRITVTGTVINNSDKIAFLVTGRKKAGIVAEIINKDENSHNFPASFVVSSYGKVNWFIDSEAAVYL